MKRAEYRSITVNETGRRIRDILAGAISRQPPTLSQLRSSIRAADIDPDSELGGAILERCRELAGQVAAGKAPFTLRQLADLSAVKYVRQLVAEDDLLGRDLLPGESEEMEAAEALRLADKLAAGDVDDTAQSQRLADQAERDRLRGLGFRPVEG